MILEETRQFGRKEKTGIAFIFLRPPSKGDRVERDSSRVSILGLGKMDLPAFEVDLTPIEAVLFAHSHSGMNGQEKVRAGNSLNRCSMAARSRIFSASDKKQTRPPPSGECLPRDSGRSSHCRSQL